MGDTYTKEVAALLEDAITATGERMLPYFKFAHLPEKLQEVSSRFAEVATWIAVNQTASAERTVALRKLLEGKDAAVRNAL